jgi:putative phage-type endonuclease
MEQRENPAWWAARLGKVTASRVADVVAKTKSGYSASRQNYLADLIVERLTGQKASSFSNAAMDWGVEQEPHARAAYSARTGELVEEAGFIDHPTIAMSGASPDGFVGEGCVEYKCPNTATHLEYLLAVKPPEKYVTQMQWQMACTGKTFCEFVSYDPRLPEHLQMLIVRITRDDKRIAELESEVQKFLTELDDKLQQLEKVK